MKHRNTFHHTGAAGTMNKLYTGRRKSCLNTIAYTREQNPHFSNLIAYLKGRANPNKYAKPPQNTNTNARRITKYLSSQTPKYDTHTRRN